MELQIVGGQEALADLDAARGVGLVVERAHPRLHLGVVVAEGDLQRRHAVGEDVVLAGGDVSAEGGQRAPHEPEVGADGVAARDAGEVRTNPQARDVDPEDRRSEGEPGPRVCLVRHHRVVDEPGVEIDVRVVGEAVPPPPRLADVAAEVEEEGVVLLGRLDAGRRGPGLEAEPGPERGVPLYILDPLGRVHLRHRGSRERGGEDHGGREEHVLRRHSFLPDSGADRTLMSRSHATRPRRTAATSEHP